MATIPKGTEVFSNVINGTIMFEDTNFPSQLTNVQTYYGDVDGAANSPTTKLYLIGERVGVTTDKPQQIIGNKTYQHLIFRVTERDRGSWPYLGPGTYNERDGGAWISINDITTDKVEAQKSEYDRVNADKIAKEKAKKEQDEKLAALLKENPPKTVVGNGENKTPVSAWAYLVAFLIAVSTGLFFWKKKQKNKQALVFQQKQSFIENNLKNQKL